MFKSKPPPEREPGTDAASAHAASDDSARAEIEVSPEAAEIVKQLQAELDEAVEARKRALADFRNYQRRAAESEQRALQTGAMKMVRAILPALDHFDLALMQKADQMTVEQLLAAVKIVRDELNKALMTQGVERIEPKQGEPFDPHRHEAVMKLPLEGAPANTIVTTLQTGFALGDVVLRPAKVSVVAGSEE